MARTEISGLKESSFSHDLPEDGLARISGYLHTNKQTLLADSAVRTWIYDGRIIGEIVWTPIMPGKKWLSLADTSAAVKAHGDH